jgi:TetR/AcrR family transcriptional regulator, tetracycline repressor protein
MDSFEHAGRSREQQEQPEQPKHADQREQREQQEQPDRGRRQQPDRERPARERRGAGRRGTGDSRERREQQRDRRIADRITRVDPDSTHGRRLGAGKLDRAVVVSAAIGLLDEVGLDGLTLRGLARDLGVAAPALYWHFRDKQELLDHMVAAIADIGEERQHEPGEPWDEWLAELARERRRALLAHRDGARLIAGARPTASQLPGIERTVATLVEEGFTPGQAFRGALVLGLYVGGFVIDEQAEAARELSAGDRTAIEFHDWLSAGDFPLLAAAFAEVGDPNSEAGFEFGLRLILDGLHAQLARNRR